MFAPLASATEVSDRLKRDVFATSGCSTRRRRLEQTCAAKAVKFYLAFFCFFLRVQRVRALVPQRFKAPMLGFVTADERRDLARYFERRPRTTPPLSALGRGRGSTEAPEYRHHPCTRRAREPRRGTRGGHVHRHGVRRGKDAFRSLLRVLALPSVPLPHHRLALLPRAALGTDASVQRAVPCGSSRIRLQIRRQQPCGAVA